MKTLTTVSDFERVIEVGNLYLVHSLALWHIWENSGCTLTSRVNVDPVYYSKGGWCCGKLVIPWGGDRYILNDYSHLWVREEEGLLEVYNYETKTKKVYKFDDFGELPEFEKVLRYAFVKKYPFRWFHCLFCETERGFSYLPRFRGKLGDPKHYLLSGFIREEILRHLGISLSEAKKMIIEHYTPWLGKERIVEEIAKYHPNWLV